MKLTLVCVLIFFLTTVCADSPEFVIRHRASALYLYFISNPADLRSFKCDDCHKVTFEKAFDNWGYIKRKNGVHIVPVSGSRSPTDGTSLFVSQDSDWDWSGLWALDGAKGHIIHKGGSYVHLASGQAPVSEGFSSRPVIRKGVPDESMRFEFVSLSDLDKKVFIYGMPTITAKWRIIYMILYPTEEYVTTIDVKVGKSRELSSTSSFQYSWEVSMKDHTGFDAFFQAMLEKTTSATWSTETTRYKTIRVKAGETLVTWQYVFEVEQNLSIGVFQSELLADTDSHMKEPTEFQYTV